MDSYASDLRVDFLFRMSETDPLAIDLTVRVFDGHVTLINHRINVT